MNAIFAAVLQKSVKALFVFLLVCIIRFLCRKIPKKYTTYLMIPVFLSLLPGLRVSGVSFVSLTDSLIRDARLSHAMHLLSEHDLLEILIPMKEHIPVRSFLMIIWMVGIAVMLGMVIWKTISLYGKLRYSIRLENDLYESDRIDSSFVFGFFRPVIYLPAGMPEEERKYVTVHETLHIRRCDHVIKQLSLILLIIYWFHPAVWIAYRMLSDDLEMACDERTADWFEEREDYLKVLVSSSGKTYPVLPSFAYGNIRNRVSHLLSYDIRQSTAAAVFAFILTFILAVIPLFGYRYSTVILQDHNMSLRGPVEHSELVCGFEEYPDHHEADYINKIHKNGDVYPLMEGIVEFVGYDEVYGRYVCISHDNGYRSYYCYLSDVSVKEGDSVSSSPIGTIGDTGGATGEHVGVAMTDEKGNYVRNLENLLFMK